MGIEFIYENSTVEQQMQPILESLQATTSYQNMVVNLNNQGQQTIHIRSISGSNSPGVAGLAGDGTPAIGINFTQYFYSEHSNHGVYPDPEVPGSTSSLRALPLNEIFFHELAHVSLGHLEQTLLDRILDSMSTSGAPGKTSISEAETIELVNQTLRAELGIPHSRLTHVLSGVGEGYYVSAISECFGSETPISMWPLDPSLKPDANGIYDQEAVRAKVWKKSIELIVAGDIVVAFDGAGNLVPSPVTRTMTNEVKVLLNFHGTKVTPGHVYFRPDSKRASKFETLIDILRDDGQIQKQDGTLVRAATDVPVGDPHDGFVQVVTGKMNDDGSINPIERGRIRLGTRFVKDRKAYCIADVIKAGGGIVGEDELIRVEDGVPVPFHWHFSDTLPKPEDFVLACSGTTLEDIYKASEWEDQRPHMPAPMVMDGGPVQPLSQVGLTAMPRNELLNLEPATAESQRTMNRKQRKAMEAKQRKATKTRKRLVS
jgi:hypothetical protein